MQTQAARLLPLILICSLANVVYISAAESPKTGEKRDTLLYIRTDPPGAKVLINGKEVGTSDGLFPVEPGTGTILVELEGRTPDKRQVIIRANAITRLELSLAPDREAKSKRGAKLEPELESRGPSFIGRLPHGTIELIGVTNFPPTEKSKWWKPDGSPIELGTFLRKSPQYSSFPRGKSMALLVRFEGIPDTASRVWKIDPSEGWWECTEVTDAQGKTLKGYRLFCPGFAKSIRTADLRVGVDGGDWETVATQRAGSPGVAHFSRDGYESTVTLQRAERFGTYTEDSTRVAFTTDEPYGVWKTRLVAVTEDGAEHAASMGSSGGKGAAIFWRLELASVKEFRLQVRSFDWVEFKNIALESGLKTDVQVISCEKPSESEK